MDRRFPLRLREPRILRWLPVPALAIGLLSILPSASATVTVSATYVWPSCNTLQILNDPYPHLTSKTGSGNYATARPTFTNATGTLAVNWRWANTNPSSAGTASIGDQPWESIGVGATGTCMSKTVANTGLLQFKYNSVSWIVQLWANCTLAGSSASASYNLSVGGDIFDYSNGGSWVLGNANRPVGVPYYPANNPFTLACTGTSGSHYWTFAAPATTFTITSKVGGTMSSSDQYYFFQYLAPYVYATSTSDASAGATLSLVTETLQYGTCPNC